LTGAARRVGLGLLVALVLAAVAGFRERSMLLARLQAALAAPPPCPRRATKAT